MDTAAFLSRVVPANGNFLTITWKGEKGWAIRSWAPDAEGCTAAAKLLVWLARKNIDVYHAIAALTVATEGKSASGKPTQRADRKGPNVQCLRVLVVDADVAREGDGKDPANVFATREAALDWLRAFSADAEFPMPNLVVDSGYGFHWYWVLETSLAPDAWEMLSQALKSAIIKHGWRGDTGSTVDSSRILRPPGTYNHKVPTDPKLVTVVPEFTSADLANDDVIAALAPYITAQTSHTKGLRHVGSGGATVHNLAGSLAARPDFIPPEDKGAALNAAAHAGIEKRAYHIKFIAARCRQMERTLTTGGKGETRDHWKLVNMTLAAHCADGEEYIHRLSSGDPRYTEAETNEVWAETQAEVIAKDLGAPLCSSFNDARRGVCIGCPHWGQIKSPIVLGQDNDDLPYGYRRATRGGQPVIEYKEKTEGEWVLVCNGDIRSPVLDELAPGGHQLGFIYHLSGAHSVSIRGLDAGEGKGTLLVSLERQGISADRHTCARIGDLIVAWINKLRSQRSVRIDKTRGFGWNYSSDGTRVGLAVAGDLYRVDGTEERVPGGDPKIAQMYRPVGDLAKWRQAAALFEGGRPDLQTLIACSFASPLMSLAGDVRGMSLNFWSTESGIGKSTAIRVGQSVWADYKALQSMKDTANHVMRSLSEPRFIIRYWDELRVRPTNQDEFVDLIFTIPQGKERGSLHADTTMREVGEWECLLAFTSNRSMQDFLVTRDDGTDAGLNRLFEIQMQRQQLPFDPQAGSIIKLCETNYGHAGRIFVKYLASHVPETQARLNQLMTVLASHLSMQQEERFSVCVMACILVGASIARKLGLFNFDINGIHKVLVDNFTAARQSRVRQTVQGTSPNGGYDVWDIISQFVYAQAEWRVRTTQFAQQGQGPVDVVVHPRLHGIRVHISEKERICRISRVELKNWLRDHQYPASTLYQQIIADTGAAEVKRTLGGGTIYSGGQVWVLDIPINERLEDMLSAAIPLAGATHLKLPKGHPARDRAVAKGQLPGVRLSPGQAVKAAGGGRGKVPGNQQRM
jgi:hypothetical protein